MKNPKLLSLAAVIAALMLVVAFTYGCEGAESGGKSTTDTDTDTDTDSDADSDSDTDSESESNTEPAADNDNDGLSNSFELENGTDPNDEDSDDDGVSDLIEWVAGTDPNDPDSNPHSEGNFYFVVPYMQDPEPPDDTLVFATDLQKADLLMLMDTTGSMGGAINNLKNDLSSIIIPDVEAIVPNIWFAVAGFDDYPVSPYGSTSTDHPFYLLSRTTESPAEAQAAVNNYALHSGGDTPESDVPALYVAATGEALGTYVAEQTECEPTEVGYPCFRPGAVPIIMLITDAPFHNAFDDYSPYEGITPEPPDWGDMGAALNEIHAKVTTVYVNSSWAGPLVSHAEQLAWDTNTQDEYGDPLIFPIDTSGSGLGDQVVEAIELLASVVPFDSISAAPRDDTTDSVDATEFIDYIEPNLVGGIEDPLNPGVFCVADLPAVDNDSDPYLDMFVDILPGTSVCFDIYPAMNESVEETPEPQVFPAFIDVLGDMFTVLDTRDVYFLVPPEAPIE